MGRRLSVIGLGKLGASMAAAMASKGHQIIGVDVGQRIVDRVNEGHAPVQETDLDEKIQANRERIRATMSHEEAVLNSEISFVIVPTPSDHRGAFSLQYAAYAFRELGKALATKDDYHTFVLTSTVLPGATRYGLLPILEKYSGKKCGEGFGLCYSPEFIALGSVIRDFLNPDFVLLGEYDQRAGEHLESCYREVVPEATPIQRMSLENAELAKISVNTFVTTKITFANMLAEICSSLPGGNIDVVSDALGLDSRIGRRYLTGALGYGGPCFPRDNVALSFIANEVGIRADIAGTTDRLNRTLAEKIITQISSLVGKDKTVAVLGLSYKPHSQVVEESQSIMMIEALLQKGARVVAYDPLAAEMANHELKGCALILGSAKECLDQAETVLITTPDPEFQQLKAADFTDGSRPVTVIDFWRILSDELTDRKGIEYIPYGRSVSDEDNASKLKELWSCQ